MDVATLKRFRQSACNDPVTMQILSLNRPKEGSSSNARRPKFAPRTTTAPKESFPSEITHVKGKGKGKSGGTTPRNNRAPPDSSKLDAIASLPHKDGKIDMEQYSKYKDEGLRQKLHDAIRARKCIRCMNTGHLRSACTEAPKSWEADFNQGKAAFWGPKLQQARPQWSLNPSTVPTTEYHLNLLVVTDSNRQIALDTYSEVSLGQSNFLSDLRLANKKLLSRELAVSKF